MKKIYRFSSVIVCLVLSTLTANAYTFTWTGGTSTAWSNSANWSVTGTGSGNTTPGSADNVIISNGSLANQPVMSASVTVLNLTISNGSLDLDQYTITVLANASLTGGTIINGAIDARDFTDIRNTTFNAGNGAIQLTKIASSGNADNTAYGNNTFNGPAAIVNQSDNFLRLAGTQGDVFNALVYFEESGSGALEPAYNGVNKFSGDISTQGSTTTVTLAAGSGTVLLNGYNTIYGSLLNVKNMIVNTTQYLNLLGSFTAETFRVWNGSIDMNSNTITVTGNAYMRGGALTDGTFEFNNLDTMQGVTFSSLSIIKMAGGSSNVVRGGNIFNGSVIIRNNDNDNFVLANVVGDDYNGDAQFLEMGAGQLEPARNGHNTFAGYISTDGTTTPVTFGADTGIVTIDGNNTQYIYGNGNRQPVFRRLRMNTSGSLSLGVETFIGSQLILKSGILNSGTYSLLVFNDNAVAIGAKNVSHVNGPVRKIGNDDFSFPTGDGNVYALIGITAPGNTNDHFTAQYFSGAYADLTFANPLDHVSTQEYWILDRTNGSSNVKVTLSHASDRSGPVDDLGSLRVARYDGTDWISQGNVNTTGNTSGGNVTTTSNISSFSPFTLASSSSLNPLPITLLNFNAVPSGVNVLVKWTTINEINNDFFTVEKSLDGKNWTVLGTVKGLGNTNVTSDYALIDFAPVEGIQYYRLRQTDVDGKEALSGIVPVRFSSEANTTIVLFPQPAGNVLNVSIQNNENENANITVYSAMGQKMIEMNSLSGNMFQIDLSDLSSGIYYLELNLDGVVTKSKIIKQ